MPARRTRQEARERALECFKAELDRMIPADESVPLRGSTFADWEGQVGRVRRTVLPVLLEERAGLEDTARVDRAGRCPRCGSDRTYLERQTTQPEVISPDGPVVVEKQHARCHACGGSFSPSDA
jgi:hypothetical protein